ncbi:CD59 glycoprotein [Castor canadensis]|uniref:CD59 glycoprotein n=5 Tax=Castor canadensis TaxID=51338 RepID=A0AC58K5T0_CASCN
MRSTEEFILLQLLLILAVLYCPGFSLTCYNCPHPTIVCKSNVTCTPNLDTCLIAMAESRVYRMCWRFSSCDTTFILNRLDERAVQYKCCQEDMCNGEISGERAAPLSGKTLLLATPFLAAIWNLCL